MLLRTGECSAKAGKGVAVGCSRTASLRTVGRSGHTDEAQEGALGVVRVHGATEARVAWNGRADGRPNAEP